MLVIRLQRTGRENMPTYRLVVAEKARPVKGKFMEIVGHYLPARDPVVIEANACGTPVIASKVNGLKDSIVDGKTGILVEVNNVTALTNAMSSLLTNSHVRALLSKNAYEWSQGFSWKKSAEKFSSIINGTQTSKTQAKKISLRPRLRLGGKI